MTMSLYPEEGGKSFLQNTGIYLPNYTGCIPEDRNINLHGRWTLEFRKIRFKLCLRRFENVARNNCTYTFCRSKTHPWSLFRWHIECYF